MSEVQNMAKFLNPLNLHLQKLDLELKCPLCLNFLKKPMLLPCNHIICQSCSPFPHEPISECPTCQNEFTATDLRPAPYMENLVTIYRGLNSTITSLTSRHSSSEQSSANLGSGHNDNSKEEQSVLAGNFVRFNAGASLTPLSSHGCKGATEGIEMREEDMHPGPEPSPVSSPSLDPSKERNFTASSLKKCKTEEPDECMVEKNSYERDVKRQKMLDYSSPEARVPGVVIYSEKVFDSDTNAASSASQLTPKSKRKGVCAFCLTSKQTAVTGPLLYYANGKEVRETEMTTASKVTTVHSKCIEWTPKVYFKGDTIKNLGSELARSAKLKCSSCGKKGAALGCFETSCRRTYHVPCAVEVEGCRWDCEDFLMLCPAHTSVMFPREKSNPKRPAPTPIPLSETSWILPHPQFWENSPDGQRQWVFCGSALSNEEMIALVKFANICGARVTKLWRPNVTHVIASTDVKGACRRTLKLLMGILHGTWILNTGWVKACTEVNQPLNEEPYEISLDNHGCLNGPKTGRLRVLKNEPKLFEGANFYFTGDFVPGYKADLIDLVRTAGGEIAESIEQLITRNTQAASTHRVVIYNADPPQGFSFNEANSVVSQKKLEALNLVSQLNCTVVGHKWILDSIAACVL